MKVSTAFRMAAAVSAQLVFMPQNNFQPTNGQALSLPINLASLYDNKAFGLSSSEADFDGSGASYPAQFIPPSKFIYSGINYNFPEYSTSTNDNTIAAGQTVAVPRGRYLAVHMLAASETGMASGAINSTFADNSTSTSPVLVPAWWSWPYPTGGDLVFPYRLTDKAIDWNRTNIFQTRNWLDSSKDLISLTLPNVTDGAATEPGGAAVESKLHIFALTLVPAAQVEGSDATLSVQYARSTQKWLEGTDMIQLYEATINNVGTRDLFDNNSVEIRIDSPGVETVVPGYIKRLRAGDQVRVSVGVQLKSGTQSGASGPATVVVTGEGVTTPEYTFNAVYGIRTYEPTYESIYTHDAPDWYDEGKFGIFIHWGPYAVPAWGNVGKNETYAEWYWWNLNQGAHTSSQTYEYHLEHYGPNVIYDEFIKNFTASAFDPKEWVDLFADAGAQYFVQVSKHHDGYAIFDLPSNVTQRTSVAQFPHRNLLQEIFDAAAQYQPHLHRAAYYSLPEWFHPDYKEYGFASWPGGNATNPFTNETMPYLGYVPVSDYITDVIVPEMSALASMGVEVMWCDIGGPNKTAEFAAEWYNTLAASKKQALMNARCGLPGDFDTPEYARYAAVQPRKWETNQGMDPYSYGYNAATPDEAYMNASTIVTLLVDIVSKNGNFLLDVGPTANGTILEIQQQHLREGGLWINSHAEAIFNSTYWSVTPQEGDSVRFLVSKDAFYIAILAKPSGLVEIASPIPWVEGDEVKVVGGGKAGTVVPSSRDPEGRVVLEVTEDVADADKYAWVFKIEY